MNVYLLIMKDGGIIVDTKAFIDCRVAIQVLRVENEFHDKAILYNVDIGKLDDEAQALKRCVSIE